MLAPDLPIIADTGLPGYRVEPVMKSFSWLRQEG
jgi:hypothetical protein